MSRNCQKTTAKAAWTEENMISAKTAVEGGMSTCQAAKQYNVPKSSLRNRLIDANEEKISHYYNKLGHLMEKNKYIAKNTYNADETVITKVTGPGKEFAEKEQRGSVTNERGSNLTVMSEAGFKMASEQPIDCRDKEEEVEKYKRRIIRMIARKISEGKPEDEMWQEIKKENGSNCKALWERMRGLTIKKLHKMLDAEDRLDRISPVSRMTVTDWLLYDMVITHQKVDVINKEELDLCGESRVLSNLFSLVQRFGLEARAGDNLAQAWASATLYYNSKGHRCSAMLMQRRWYQLKELTRAQFYQFWYRYRGNQRQLSAAKQYSPAELQKAIALKYPHVITKKFLTWDEMIQKRLVILPHELSNKMKQGDLMQASDTSAPDLVLVEQKIDVVDLRSTSDSEDEEEQAEKEPEIQPMVKIKSEPIDEDMEQYQQPEQRSVVDEVIDRLQMTEEHVDEDSVDTNIKDSIVIDPTPLLVNDEEGSVDGDELVIDQNAPMDNIENVPTDVNESGLTKDSDAEISDDAIVIDDGDDDDDEETSVQNENVNIKMDNNEIESDEQNEIVSEVTATESNVNDMEVEDSSDIPEIAAVSSAGMKVENVKDVLGITEQTVCNDSSDLNENLPVISTISSAGVKIEKCMAISHDVDNASGKSDTVSVQEVDQNEMSDKMPLISTVCSQGVKIESHQVNETPKYETNLVDNVISDIKKSENPSGEINLKGFSEVPADLNFAREGFNFADDGIEYIEDEEHDIIRVIDTFPHPIKEENEVESEEPQELSSNSENHDRNQKFDLKLLMCPVVYTTKLDAMSVFRNDNDIGYNHVEGIQKIDQIHTLSKPISVKSITTLNMNEPGVLDVTENNNTVKTNVSDDDLFKDGNDSNGDLDSDASEDFIDESQRVKMSSLMLRKPKNRSYNPVVLCKNPDFNTRLKKLSVGFFMSIRNRTLLQTCIPVTIDMSKTFESKLINGTLYLKDVPQVSSVKNDPVIEINDDVERTSGNLIQPTALQQSFDLNIDEILENELRQRMAERVRAINLPDISQVRRLNQHLLTAEVTPLRLDDDKSKSDSSKLVQIIKDDVENILSQQEEIKNSNNISVEIPLHKDQDTVPTPPALLAKNPQLWMHHNQPKSMTMPLQPRSIKPALTSTTTAHTENILNKARPLSRPRMPPLEDINKTVQKIRKPIRKTYYPNVSWNKPKVKPTHDLAEQYHSEALLTIDTLYKMLSALDPCPDTSNWTNYVQKCPKKKKENENRQDVQTEHKNEPIKENENKEEIIDLSDEEGIAKPIKKKRRMKVGDKYFCCFKRYRLEVELGQAKDTKRKHRCVGDKCKCCCRLIYADKQKTAAIEQPASSIDEGTATETAVSSIVEEDLPADQSKSPNLNVGFTIVDADIADITSLKETSTSPTDNVNSQNTIKCPLTPKFRVCAAQNTEYMSMNPEYSINISNTDMEENDNYIVTSSQENEHSTEDQTALNTTINSKISHEISTSNPNSDYTPKVHKKSQENQFSQKNTSEETLVNLAPIKLAYRSKQIMMKSAIPCSCLPKTRKSKKNTIEIDSGIINTCNLHKKTKLEPKLNKSRRNKIHERKVILKRNFDKHEKKPFFVGKGKILLTNMKMPKELPPRSPPKPLYKHIKLPEGVQILLMPDNTLTYAVLPGVNITPEEQELLPQFIIALKEQLNTLGVATPTAVDKSNEIIDLDNEEISENHTMPTATPCISNADTETLTATLVNGSVNESINETAKETDASVVETSNKNSDLEIQTGIREVEKNANEISFANSMENQRVTNLQNDNDTKPITDINQPNSDKDSVESGQDGPLEQHAEPIPIKENSNKKSLLSDLMEMSGIMEEDLAPVPVIEPIEPIVLDTSNLVLQQLVNPPAPESPTKTVTKTLGTSQEVELVAITSFIQMKYASENNGLFFKLDLDSGELTSINVCIQKCDQQASTENSSVIDLTDEPEQMTVQKIPATKLNYLKNFEYQQKPERLSPIILQKKDRLMKRLHNNLKPANIPQSKKQVTRFMAGAQKFFTTLPLSKPKSVLKIDTNINLEDSDAPMEEEYLYSSDTSDDEPLIHKAKRKRLDDTHNADQDPSNVQNDASLIDQPTDASGNINESSVLEETSEKSPVDNCIESVDQNNQQSRTDNSNEDAGEHVEIQENEGSQDEHEFLEDEQSDCEYDQDLDSQNEHTTQEESSSSMPVPTNLLLSGGAFNSHNIPLNYTLNNDQDDDCILGV